MQMNPDKDTRLCISLSGRPGNFGLRFHNHLYEQLGRLRQVLSLSEAA